MPLKSLHIKFSMPKDERKKLDGIFSDLKKVRNDYKDVLPLSVLGTAAKGFSNLISSKKKKESTRRKNELIGKLTGWEKTVNELYSKYYEDKSARLMCKAILNTIYAYLKKLGQKDVNKSTDFKISAPISKKIAPMIKNLLESSNEILQKMGKDKNIKELIKLPKQAGEVLSEIDELIKSAKGYKINCDAYTAKIAVAREEIKGMGSSFEEFMRGTYKADLKKLTDRCNKGENWEKIESDAKTFYEKLEKLLLESENINADNGQKKRLEEILKDLRSTADEITQKVKFAKAMENYYVFDHNMSIDIKDSLKPLEDLKNIVGKYSDRVKCASQPCLPIAQDGKMNKQYDHSWNATGPYYILVDKNSNQQVEKAVRSGVKTINKSNREPDACSEVEEYLKNALQSGTFDESNFNNK